MLFLTFRSFVVAPDCSGRFNWRALEIQCKNHQFQHNWVLSTSWFSRIVATLCWVRCFWNSFSPRTWKQRAFWLFGACGSPSSRQTDKPRRMRKAQNINLVRNAFLKLFLLIRGRLVVVFEISSSSCCLAAYFRKFNWNHSVRAA